MNAETQRSRVDRLLDRIERIGNKLPEPFILFAILLGLLAVVSTVMAMLGVTAQVPGQAEPVVIRGAFTPEGVEFLFTTLADNFVEFPPLKNVVTILLAVGLAERTGLLTAFIRWAFGSAPPWLLPYAVGVIGVSANVMSDAAFVVIPPLAALVFSAAGRHPVAGLLGGFAAVGAGYSTSVIVTSLDALFAGITSGIAESMPDPGTPVNPASNLYFNAVSAVLLGVLAGVIIARVVEPAMERAGVSRVEVDDEETDAGEAGKSRQGEVTTVELTRVERRGLVLAGLTVLLATAGVLALALIPGSPLQNDTGGFLPESPLLDSIVTLAFLLFFLPALVYGIVVGAIRRSADIPALMARAIRDLAGFLVLAFILGQFIALFDWSRIGTWVAVVGADGLQAIGLTGFPAIVAFMLLASLLNLFIISGSSLWTLMAGVFVPLFLLLGFEPGFIQAAFRVGDAATQVMTPLNPYMIVLLTFVRRYEPHAGIGTVMARMVPFVVPFWLTWAAVLAVFYFAGVPIGPGMDARLP
ncbi:AbgT family transporter [Allosaccharopolyspora coralli]|uniref:AbgT family transporter n=1 Tax=Allosaccharopolyspora coralli TaxID=2665642 RepID=A0A5Q3QIR6_9PSEU|nr:AbgT family transporter [Allosaccharopolyspora coralli]QGK70737.1 AbgT family transporter [Allosaccharopolyspora coralli]